MIANSIINIINKFISGIASFGNLLFSVLPDSPFNNIGGNSFFNTISGKVNYFLPINQMMIIFSTWLISIATYYIVMIALRWLKAIE